MKMNIRLGQMDNKIRLLKQNAIKRVLEVGEMVLEEFGDKLEIETLNLAPHDTGTLKDTFWRYPFAERSGRYTVLMGYGNPDLMNRWKTRLMQAGLWDTWYEFLWHKPKRVSKYMLEYHAGGLGGGSRSRQGVKSQSGQPFFLSEPAMRLEDELMGALALGVDYALSTL